MVNDLGGARTGEGSDTGPAQAVVDEITAAGGKAAANGDDFCSWAGGEGMVNQAIETFGGLDILVNNAGILRDKMSFNMTEEEWDSVVKVHLKGHFAPSRFAAAYWRQKSKDDGAAGERQDREHRVGVGPVRQRRPGELRRGQGRHRGHDDRARTRARALRRARELHRTGRAHPPHRGPHGRRADADEAAKASLDPANIAAGVGWLASDLSDGVNGQVLKIQGGMAQIVQGWRPVTQVTTDKPWTIESIAEHRDELFANSDPGIPPFFLNINDPT